jgi:hypothetical protein
MHLYLDEASLILFSLGLETGGLVAAAVNDDDIYLNILQ